MAGGVGYDRDSAAGDETVIAVWNLNATNFAPRPPGSQERQEIKTSSFALLAFWQSWRKRLLQFRISRIKEYDSSSSNPPRFAGRDHRSSPHHLARWIAA